jgi:hypothetical protein
MIFNPINLINPIKVGVLMKDKMQGGITLNILVRAEFMRCPWLQAETKVATILGNFSTLVLLAPPLFKIAEVVLGFQMFAWAPKRKE